MNDNSNESAMEIKKACELLDTVMCMDLNLRGAAKKLYEAARQLTGDLPLTYAAAKRIIEQTNPGDVVFFLTGLLVRSPIAPSIAESDGPVGTAVLIYTMQRALGITPIIITDKSIIHPMENVMRHAGCIRVPVGTVQKVCAPGKWPTRAFALTTMPDDAAAALAEAGRLINVYDPAAVISCERAGPNVFGIIHNSQGFDISRGHCRSDQLFKAAYWKCAPRPVTVGIGDGGNELGMGNIAGSLYEWLPHGDKCRCDCGGGIIPETKCDALITSAVSNWGASALAAALVIMTGNLSALAGPELHRRLLNGAADAGFIDSTTGEAAARTDGIDLDVHLAVAEEFAQIARAVINRAEVVWDRK